MQGGSEVQSQPENHAIKIRYTHNFFFNFKHYCFENIDRYCFYLKQRFWFYCGYCALQQSVSEISIVFGRHLHHSYRLFEYEISVIKNLLQSKNIYKPCAGSLPNSNT